MAIKKIQIKPPDNNYADVLHPETDSTMVLMGDGSTLEQFKTSHSADLTSHGEILSMYRSNKDANDIYTTIEWKRPDGKLAKKSVLSGGTSPKYTTRAVTYYEADGTTVKLTKTYTITYTDDDMTSEVLT